jgi:hypothetical protein
MLKLLLSVSFLLAAPCGALAQSQSNAEQQAASELSGEMLECSVYFRIVATCLQGVPDTRVPEAIRQLNESASKIGGIAMSTGAAIGVSIDGQQAKSKSLRDEMMSSLSNTCHNIAILLHRYHNFCQQLTDNSDPRRAELLQEKKCTGSYKC